MGEGEVVRRGVVSEGHRCHILGRACGRTACKRAVGSGLDGVAVLWERYWGGGGRGGRGGAGAQMGRGTGGARELACALEGNWWRGAIRLTGVWLCAVRVQRLTLTRRRS